MSSNPLLTVIIPCYNEKHNIEKIIGKVQIVKLQKEIILVDDFSIDGTREIINEKLSKENLKIIFHKKNFGKGAAIKSATKYINGKIVIIQDADLEYDPNEYHKLIEPIINKKTNVVYGSRALNKNNFIGKLTIQQNYRILGNKILTLISNLLNNQELTDAHTCYKIFDKEVFLNLEIESNDFAFCPEATTKLSILKEKIIEIPISYKGRSYEEGKKIKLRDFFLAIFSIIRFKYLSKFKKNK